MQHTRVYLAMSCLLQVDVCARMKAGPSEIGIKLVSAGRDVGHWGRGSMQGCKLRMHWASISKRRPHEPCFRNYSTLTLTTEARWDAPLAVTMTRKIHQSECECSLKNAIQLVAHYIHWIPDNYQTRGRRQEAESSAASVPGQSLQSQSRHQ